MRMTKTELAKKIYDVGFVKTDVFYDYQEEKQMTIEDIEKYLETMSDVGYLLESIVQFLDGSQNEDDHKLFYNITMDIIHFMEEQK